MPKNPFCSAVREMSDFFERSTSSLEEGDSAYTPMPGMFTVAQQVAHAAQSIEWFLEGAFRPEGFDLEFAALETAVRKVTSLEEARAWFQRAVEEALALLEGKSAEEMMAPIAPGPIMGGAPRSAVVLAMSDHTAHHRGALSVYVRLRGRTPPMPYG